VQIGPVGEVDDGSGNFPILRSSILRANENYVASCKKAAAHRKSPAHWRVLNENFSGSFHM